MIGINPDYDYLYEAQPAGWCVECGAEVWEHGQELCTRCRRRLGDDDEG